MKQFVIAGTLVGALACGATAFAQAEKQQPPPAPPKSTGAKTAPAGGTQAADKPAAKPRQHHAAAGDKAAASHTAPKDQPNTTQDANAQNGALALGNVHIPKAVKADGKDLAAGTYQVRLTADEAK